MFEGFRQMGKASVKSHGGIVLRVVGRREGMRSTGPSAATDELQDNVRNTLLLRFA